MVWISFIQLVVHCAKKLRVKSKLKNPSPITLEITEEGLRLGVILFLCLLIHTLELPQKEISNLLVVENK
jgi:hypothetical protein